MKKKWKKQLQLSMAFCILLLCNTNAIKWLSFENIVLDHINDCENSAFTLKQVKFCKRQFDMMYYLPQSVKITKTTCKEQMKNRRWNCETINNAPEYGVDLKEDTRESAFVHALFSASLSYAVTRGCLTGGVPNCGCNYNNRRRSFSSTSDDDEKLKINCPIGVAKGVNFAKHFVSMAWKKRRKYLLTNQIKLHNSKVGRMTFSEQQGLACRCHGVSGTCAEKTCWKTFPFFKAVSYHLQQKYDEAVKVIYNPRDKRFVPQWETIREIKPTELIYGYESPNYCERDNETGTMGTAGRRCNQSSTNYDSCAVMCCGRGIDIQTIEVIKRCSCKYHWCCQVKCEHCRKIVDIHRCK